MSRKILYSPDFGAGWVTWHSGPHEEKQFMLTYAPFIEAIEKGIPIMDPRDAGFALNPKYSNSPLILQFLEDWQAKFGPSRDTPYLGGLRGLTVATVRGKVRLHEYEGAESYEEEGEYKGWI